MKRYHVQWQAKSDGQWRTFHVTNDVEVAQQVAARRVKYHAVRILDNEASHA